MPCVVYGARDITLIFTHPMDCPEHSLSYLISYLIPHILHIIVYVTYKYKNQPQIYYCMTYISLLGKPPPSPAGAWAAGGGADLNWGIKK